MKGFLLTLHLRHCSLSIIAQAVPKGCLFTTGDSQRVGTYLARCDTKRKRSMTSGPALAPPFTPNESTPPNPRLRYFLAGLWELWLSRPVAESMLRRSHCHVLDQKTKGLLRDAKLGAEPTWVAHPIYPPVAI